jgi:hypothetical protein
MEERHLLVEKTLTLDMKHFFKVNLYSIAPTKESAWTVVQAFGPGAALAIADRRCITSPFEIKEDSASEISEQEYNQLTQIRV